MSLAGKALGLAGCNFVEFIQGYIDREIADDNCP
jgi:hypothetical protein